MPPYEARMYEVTQAANIQAEDRLAQVEKLFSRHIGACPCRLRTTHKPIILVGELGFD